MNLIRIYGELKAENARNDEVWEQICWHGANEKDKLKHRKRDNKLNNLIDKVELKISNKYNVNF